MSCSFLTSKGSHSSQTNYFQICNCICHKQTLIFTDLPPKAQLDDLASLLQLDTKNIDPEKLGIDLIKQQQGINLKFSSNQSAVIPDDRAQIMFGWSKFSTFLFMPLNA